MIRRRTVLGGAAALAALPLVRARADAAPLELLGPGEQGALVVGKTSPGAKVSVDGKKVSVSAQGLFAFGFAYDQTAPTHIAVNCADGTQLSRDATPVVRKYEVQAINGLPENYVSPPPDIEARIRAEHARLAQVRTLDSAQTWFAEPFDWPAKGIISGVFGSRRVLNGVPSAPHFGVDIAGGEGAPIHAPAGAIVRMAEPFYLEGGFTLLDHGHGVFTEYLHQSKQLVAVGDVVERGQQIGNIGHTGRATGPHLHWAMNWFQVRLDPSQSTRTPAPDKG